MQSHPRHWYVPYIQTKLPTISNRSIHSILIVGELEITEIPLKTSIRAWMLRRFQTARPLCHLDIRIGTIRRLRTGKRRNSIRLHPQLAFNTNPLCFFLLLFVRIDLGDASRVTCCSGTEEFVAPDPGIPVERGSAGMTPRGS